MSTGELRRTSGLAYREAAPTGAESGDPVVLVHGFPQSSRMWAPLMEALSEAGRRSIAPDLYALGDSDGDAPTTFEANLDAFGRFADELELERVALVVHDWGGFVGLAWACEHPDSVEALVLSDTGFFADGKWHGMAQAMRTPEVGEQALAGLDRDGFGGLLRASSPGFDDAALDEYWKGLSSEGGKRNALELYRSGDFEKLAGYRLADLDVPALLIWGAGDEFAPIAGAHRFESELPNTELVAIEGAGHFVWDEEPQRCTDALLAFLGRLD
jgi:haloalkane dehalogenase